MVLKHDIKNMETQKQEQTKYVQTVMKEKNSLNLELPLVPQMGENLDAWIAHVACKKNIVVSALSFHDIIHELALKKYLSLYTETTGLRSYHQDRLFSIIISDGDMAYYFNFIQYANLDWPYVLP